MAGFSLDRCNRQWFDRFADVDWREEARLVGAAVLMIIPICLLSWHLQGHPSGSAAVYLEHLGSDLERRFLPMSRYISERLWQPIGRFLDPKVAQISRRLQLISDYLEQQKFIFADTIRQLLLRERRQGWRPPGRPGRLRPGRLRPAQRVPSSTRRYSEQFPHLCIWGWPSRGGVIILEHATAVDCEFLGLSHLHLFEKRNPIQEEEDKMCQKLLHLGAKWWDSEARYQDVMVWNRSKFERRGFDMRRYPTPSESRWVSVGWPSTGGLWVARFSGGYSLIANRERNYHPPDEFTILKLVRTMDERCQVLQDHFDAKFYNDVKEVKDEFMNSWETKLHGEVGPMLVERNGEYVAVSPGPPGWFPYSSEDEDEDEEQHE